jgi:hypothetical protein
MICSGINSMLDNPGEPEPDPMFGKLNPINPDTEPDRSLFSLLRPDFIRSSINTPECCGKNKVAGGNEVPEVPEIIDALRE